MALAPGERASVSIIVADEDTAIAAGSGDVPVLATPRLLALAEAAAVTAVAPHLPPERTSVGTSALVEHRRASAVGAEVIVEAELIEVDGRRLAFSFIARDAHAVEPSDQTEPLVVGAGTMERVVVDRDAFLAHTSRCAE